MNKGYNETKVKSISAIPQKTKKINESRIQNALLQKKYKTNFNDRKYAIKIIKTQLAKIEQQPSKPRGFSKSIPVIRKFLAKISTPKRKIYKLRLQTDHFSKAKNETHINNKYIEEVGIDHLKF